MTRDSSAAAVYFALVVVAFGPFAIANTFVADRFWEWYLLSFFRFQPTYLEFYLFFAFIGLIRMSRYVHEGMFRWKDALVGSLLNPALLFFAGYLVHIAIRPR